MNEEIEHLNSNIRNNLNKMKNNKGGINQKKMMNLGNDGNKTIKEDQTMKKVKKH